jgi:hypothetical protein
VELIELTKPSDKDRQEILKLFYGVFPGDQEHLTKKFAHMLYSNEIVRVIVIKNDQKEVVSSLFLIEGKMDFETKQYLYCNMSYYVTEVKHRGGQAAHLISDYVVNVIQKEYDLVIGFPRHVMQGYWGRYGFTEITNSKCFDLKMNIDIADALTPLFYRVATDEDCLKLSEMSKVFKSLNSIKLERSASKWSYLIKILQSSGGKVVMGFDSENIPLGYAAIQNSKIVELSSPDLPISKFISKDFFSHLGIDSISLDVRGIPTTQLESRDIFADELFSRCAPLDRELWDLMFFSKHPQIHAHLLSRESLDSPLGKTPPNPEEGHFFSDFTILDQQ